jgi:uncharacterized cupin superfamily protein
MPSPYRTRNLDAARKQKTKPHEVFHIDDVPRIEWSAGEKFGGIDRRLGAFGGCVQFGTRLEEIPPGRWNSTFHWHTHEEEHFFILDGKGSFRIGAREVPIGPGNYVVFPANGKVAHAMKNTGRTPLRFLVIGTRSTGDVCVYPDSGKIAVEGIRKVGRFQAADYWDGEVEAPGRAAPRKPPARAARKKKTRRGAPDRR